MSTTGYQIDLPAFNGPLDLLLHLIERQELDITTISLVQVTGQYLAQVEQLKEENRLEQLVDFLVIAARLVLIKSRALLPQTPILSTGEDEDEDPTEALVRQLRQYRQFKQAAVWLQQREVKGLRTYLRIAPPPKMEGQLDLSGITVESLIAAMRAALARVDSWDDSVALAQPQRITIEGQIRQLRRRLGAGRTSLFHQLLPDRAGRTEIAITLLAILELIKRREIEARQTNLFGPIEITAVNNSGHKGENL